TRPAPTTSPIRRPPQPTPPTTPPTKPCIEPAQQQKRDQLRQNSRCGVFFSPSLPALQISQAFDQAEQSYSTYKNFLATSSRTKTDLQRLNKLFEQAYAAYTPFQNHPEIVHRTAANMRIADLHLHQHVAYCESIQQMRPVFKQQAEQSVLEKLGEVLQKRGVPEHLISPLSKRFLSKPHGQQLLSCIVEKVSLSFDTQIYQNAIPFTQKALQYYKLALSLLKQSPPSFPSWVQYLHNKIKSLEKNP
ncbi:hypothetical protein L6R29_10925, partial [Myxococcota bacterium]|nr:hypothetical protein [Myxococcota bacterium]